MGKKSVLEETFALHIRAEKLPEPVRELKFHSVRQWRFDFAWPELKLAVEVEGITSYGKNKNGSMRLGRHQTAKGVEEDCIKYGEAMKLGWTVYRCTGAIIKSGAAIETLKVLMRLSGVDTVEAKTEKAVAIVNSMYGGGKEKQQQ